MPTTTDYPRTMVLLAVLTLISLLLGHVDAAAKTKAEESASSRGSAGKPKEAEPVIEEVTAKQLERLLNEKDFVAVYWCKCLLSVALM
ncbi:protein disulfide-isomerase [Lasius niger]|uniref:Protein disulfide-isomerase n=1 Tax=Lasius niger TaxID=67767 RepID=A0A0J7NAM1_LASNI|nr:protein disulfide-isomerase [Lasius niger]